MFSYIPRNANVLLLCDTRTKADANFDAKNAPEPGAQAVLRYWWPGIEVWGKGGWDTDVARVALFEFGQEVKAPQRKAARAELTEFLGRHKFRHIIVLQSRSKSARKVYDDDYAKSSHSGTVVWDFFDPPDTIAPGKDNPGMAGTFWETKYGTIVALQNPQNVDYVYGAMICRWLRAIKANMPIFRPPADTTHTETGEQMVQGLQALFVSAVAGKPIAIDIESYSTQDLITVIGLSDGENTCAVPWEPFQPHGQSYIEPGEHLSSRGQLVCRILATAKTVILHNGVKFDIPYLARKGVPITGKVFDTFLAHGIAYGQFRHGLQACVSYEFVVPPWKSMHRQAAASNGLDPEDAEAWIQDPPELRGYCSYDTSYTWWLGQALAERGGVSL